MCGHGLCCLFVTTLINDPSVGIEKALCASGHSSIAAQHSYMTLDGTSKARLGMETKKGDGQANYR